MIDNNIRQPSNAVDNRLLYDILLRLIDTNLNIYIGIQVNHCVKSVQIRRFFWSVFSQIRTEYKEILPPYLDTFHAVIANERSSTSSLCFDWLFAVAVG